MEVETDEQQSDLNFWISTSISIMGLLLYLYFKNTYHWGTYADIAIGTSAISADRFLSLLRKKVFTLSRFRKIHIAIELIEHSLYGVILIFAILMANSISEFNK